MSLRVVLTSEIVYYVEWIRYLPTYIHVGSYMYEIYLPIYHLSICQIGRQSLSAHNTTQ
jgi:hypothetical protein